MVKGNLHFIYQEVNFQRRPSSIQYCLTMRNAVSFASEPELA